MRTAPYTCIIHAARSRTEAKRPPRSSSLDTVVGDSPRVTTIDYRGYKQLVEYDLPPLVKRLGEGRKEACNSICIISALSGGVLAALLQTLDNDPATPLRVLLCASIIFSLGATTGAVVCLCALSELANKARILAATGESTLPRKLLLNELIHVEYLQEHREREILWKFGLRWTGFLARSLMLTCFFLGTVCNFIGFGIWVWHQGFLIVSIVVTVILVIVGGISLIVLLLLFFEK